MRLHRASRPLRRAGVSGRHVRRGFSLIEVIIVIGVTTAGFLALLRLQIGAVQATATSRDLQSATNLGEHLSMTLRLEALQWTPSGKQWNDPSFTYLKKAPITVTAGAASAWLVAYPAAAGTDGRVGPVGRDTTVDSGILQEIPATRNQQYCVHYRLTWVIPDLLLRADIRVMWARNHADFAKYAACPVGMETDFYNVNSVTTPVSLIRNVFVKTVGT